MNRETFWAVDDLGHFPPLRGFHQADAVVVGGGFTGITTALWLCRAGLRVTLLEGETLACGTGCCATAVACALNGLTGNQVTVKLLGGELEIEWDREADLVYMTGPAVTVFEGEVEI